MFPTKVDHKLGNYWTKAGSNKLLEDLFYILHMKAQSTHIAGSSINSADAVIKSTEQSSQLLLTLLPGVQGGVQLLQSV